MEYFTVKNWSQFQHYRDRNPPWIKLHFALLSSSDWVTLDDASRVLAVACMLIASRNEGRVPNDPAYLKRVAYLNRTPNFKPLIDCGFLQSASACKQMLATARPETEERQRQRREEAEAEESDGAALERPKGVNGNAVEYIPLKDGSQFAVSPAYALELARLYPKVDVPQTLREIRGYNLANDTKRQPPETIKGHIDSWMRREQNGGTAKV